MQNMISACKPHQSHRAAALLPPPRPVLPGRAAFPRLLPARDATTSRLVVKRRCQGEDKQQQQEEQEAAEGSGGADEQEKRTFLSLEEAGLVEMSGLSTHERFLCRLTISSLNLLRVISEQEGVPIEELNAGRVCDWFIKDKLKREQNLGTAVLQWDDPAF
ncbi:uncharacterized protein LOC120641911 [Panicum virgatum]|uniref:Uncharacterized protein n=1 Tax=Panicum virgatum TaxID=38727 RepID=A0A8T0QM42_PANVG|nr:uncharacterized protein LOC120641911 [Panicum virgatum]KAG2575053.1 hypothetical protein PVAP13_7KG405600 [Panicum virgatum]